ncbi:1-(5-phosphoribosyl)-5-((5-phosphoribosylamino)methylideneamino) imidazole-4-carboxamide isomerase [Gammaproteobacteria bacterium]
MVSETSKHIKPTDILLHQKSRILEITFEDGAQFHLPCEYLRVYSPSAEVQGHGPGQEVLQVGKEDVNIKNIEPMGNYAILLHFDDDHNTGIYSWQYLYSLGKNQESLWKGYLERLEAAGHQRKAPHTQ